MKYCMEGTKNQRTIERAECQKERDSRTHKIKNSRKRDREREREK